MIRRIFGSLYFLTFLNGFLLASLVYFKMEASYEKDLFQAIHTDIDNRVNHNSSQDSILAKVMHESHLLMVNRESVFEGKQFAGFKTEILEPTSIDLMTARGACGSYSIVLARILQGFNFQVRIAQMKVGDIYAAHNVVEAETHHGWVILDPLFDAYFIKPTGELAGFNDLKNNWDYYKKQTPPGYDPKYRYEDVRYSNWNKIPFVSPAVKKILDFTLGKERADKISLRVYFLRKYNICFDILLVVFIFVFSYTLLRLIKSKVFPQQNIPLTFSNVYKYFRLRFFEKNRFIEHSSA
jgi:hypothetical protein